MRRFLPIVITLLLCHFVTLQLVKANHMCGQDCDHFSETEHDFLGRPACDHGCRGDMNTGNQAEEAAGGAVEYSQQTDSPTSVQAVTQQLAVQVAQAQQAAESKAEEAVTKPGRSGCTNGNCCFYTGECSHLGNNYYCTPANPTQNIWGYCTEGDNKVRTGDDILADLSKNIPLSELYETPLNSIYAQEIDAIKNKGIPTDEIEEEIKTFLTDKTKEKFQPIIEAKQAEVKRKFDLVSSANDKEILDECTKSNSACDCSSIVKASQCLLDKDNSVIALGNYDATRNNQAINSNITAQNQALDTINRALNFSQKDCPYCQGPGDVNIARARIIEKLFPQVEVEKLTNLIQTIQSTKNKIASNPSNPDQTYINASKISAETAVAIKDLLGDTDATKTLISAVSGQLQSQAESINYSLAAQKLPTIADSDRVTQLAAEYGLSTDATKQLVAAGQQYAADVQKAKLAAEATAQKQAQTDSALNKILQLPGDKQEKEYHDQKAEILKGLDADQIKIVEDKLTSIQKIKAALQKTTSYDTLDQHDRDIARNLTVEEKKIYTDAIARERLIQEYANSDSSLQRQFIFNQLSSVEQAQAKALKSLNDQKVNQILISQPKIEIIPGGSVTSVCINPAQVNTITSKVVGLQGVNTTETKTCLWGCSSGACTPGTPEQIAATVTAAKDAKVDLKEYLGQANSTDIQLFENPTVPEPVRQALIDQYQHQKSEQATAYVDQTLNSGHLNPVGFNSPQAFNELLDKIASLSVPEANKIVNLQQGIGKAIANSIFCNQNETYRDFHSKDCFKWSSLLIDTATSKALLPLTITGNPHPSFVESIATSGMIFGDPNNPNFQAQYIPIAKTQCGIPAGLTDYSEEQKACLEARFIGLKFKFANIESQNKTNAAINVGATVLGFFSGGTSYALKQAGANIALQFAPRLVQNVVVAAAFADNLTGSDRAGAVAIQTLANSGIGTSAQQQVWQEQAQAAQAEVHAAYQQNLITGIALSVIMEGSGEAFGKFISPYNNNRFTEFFLGKNVLPDVLDSVPGIVRDQIWSPEDIIKPTDEVKIGFFTRDGQKFSNNDSIAGRDFINTFRSIFGYSEGTIVETNGRMFKVTADGKLLEYVFPSGATTTTLPLLQSGSTAATHNATATIIARDFDLAAKPSSPLLNDSAEILQPDGQILGTTVENMRNHPPRNAVALLTDTSSGSPVKKIVWFDESGFPRELTSKTGTEPSTQTLRQVDDYIIPPEKLQAEITHITTETDQAVAQLPKSSGTRGLPNPKPGTRVMIIDPKNNFTGPVDIEVVRSTPFSTGSIATVNGKQFIKTPTSWLQDNLVTKVSMAVAAAIALPKTATSVVTAPVPAVTTQQTTIRTVNRWANRVVFGSLGAVSEFIGKQIENLQAKLAKPSVPALVSATVPLTVKIVDSSGREIKVGDSLTLVSATSKEVNKATVEKIILDTRNNEPRVVVKLVKGGSTSFSQKDISSRPNQLTVDTPSSAPTAPAMTPAINLATFAKQIGQQIVDNLFPQRIIEQNSNKIINVAGGKQPLYQDIIRNAGGPNSQPTLSQARRSEQQSILDLVQRQNNSLNLGLSPDQITQVAKNIYGQLSLEKSLPYLTITQNPIVQSGSRVIDYVGSNHPVGQDSAVVIPAGATTIAIVADGHGTYGHIASKTATDNFARQYLNSKQPTIPEALREAVSKTDKLIEQSVSGKDSGGTTLTAAIQVGNQLYIAHVGDSRLYIVNSKTRTATQITQDHNWPKNARKYGILVSRSLGDIDIKTISRGEFTATPDIYGPITLNKGDAIVIGSDSLEKLERKIPGKIEDEISQTVLSLNPAQAAHQLAQKANDANVKDDISVIVLRINKLGGKIEGNAPTTLPILLAPVVQNTLLDSLTAAISPWLPPIAHLLATNPQFISQVNWYWNNLGLVASRSFDATVNLFTREPLPNKSLPAVITTLNNIASETQQLTETYKPDACSKCRVEFSKVLYLLQNAKTAKSSEEQINLFDEVYTLMLDHLFDNQPAYASARILTEVELFALFGVNKDELTNSLKEGLSIVRQARTETPLDSSSYSPSTRLSRLETKIEELMARINPTLTDIFEDKTPEAVDFKKFIYYITGIWLEPGNEYKLAQRMQDDALVVRQKYHLPSRQLKIDQPAEYINQLKAIAQKEGVSIRSGIEFQKFFEKHSAAAVYLDDINTIVIPLRDVNEYKGIFDYATNLEHELIHALQDKYYPSMPIEGMEYEAYTINRSPTYLENNPIDAIEISFSFFIRGSVNHWYKDQEVISKPWDDIKPPSPKSPLSQALENLPCALGYDQTPQKTILADGSLTDLRTNVATSRLSKGSVSEEIDIVKSVDPRGVAPLPPSLTNATPHWRGPTLLISISNIFDWFVPSVSAAGPRAPCGTFNISDPKLSDVGTFEKRNDGLYFAGTKITPEGILVTAATGDQVKLSLSSPDKIKVDNQPDRNWLKFNWQWPGIRANINSSDLMANIKKNNIPVPSQNYYINEEKASNWINSFSGQDKEIAKLIILNISHITFTQFLESLTQTVSSLNSSLVNKRYVILVNSLDLNENKSTSWIYDIVKPFLPPGGEIVKTTDIQNWIRKNPNVKDFVVLDDASYSAIQLKQKIGFVNQLKLTSPTVHISIPFMTNYSISQVLNDYKFPIVFHGNQKIESFQEIIDRSNINSEVKRRIYELYSVYQRNVLSLLFFDHKMPDQSSTALPFEGELGLMTQDGLPINKLILVPNIPFIQNITPPYKKSTPIFPILLAPMGGILGMANPLGLITSPVVLPILLIQSTNQLLQQNWPDLPISKALDNVANFRFRSIVRDIKDNLDPNSLGNLFDLSQVDLSKTNIKFTLSVFSNGKNTKEQVIDHFKQHPLRLTIGENDKLQLINPNDADYLALAQEENVSLADIQVIVMGISYTTQDIFSDPAAGGFQITMVGDKIPTTHTGIDQEIVNETRGLPPGTEIAILADGNVLAKYQKVGNDSWTKVDHSAESGGGFLDFVVPPPGPKPDKIKLENLERLFPGGNVSTYHEVPWQGWDKELNMLEQTFEVDTAFDTQRFLRNVLKFIQPKNLVKTGLDFTPTGIAAHLSLTDIWGIFRGAGTATRGNRVIEASAKLAFAIFPFTPTTTFHQFTDKWMAFRMAIMARETISIAFPINWQVVTIQAKGQPEILFSSPISGLNTRLGEIIDLLLQEGTIVRVTLQNGNISNYTVQNGKLIPYQAYLKAQGQADVSQAVQPNLASFIANAQGME